MDESRHIGLALKQITHRIDRHLANIPIDDATCYHGRIIGYLWKNREHDVYQRDIEKSFGIQPSTATRLLQLMESNGLIVRESVSSDARLKKIVLTPKAMAIEQQIRAVIDRFEEELALAFTPEEEEEFWRLTEKLKKKLSEMEHKK